MRLLVIAARDDHRLLIRKHVEIQWPDAAMVEHILGEDPDLDESFAAVGFDAVLIVGASPATEAAIDLAAAQAAKLEFAPIILLLLEDAPQFPPPEVAGVHRNENVGATEFVGDQ